METSATDNGFALTLLYYHLYQRSKLNESDLQKIAASKKYKANPKLLMPDLSQKYGFPPPLSISHMELIRLLAIYPIPQAFANLVGPLRQDFSVYKHELDMNS